MHRAPYSPQGSGDLDDAGSGQAISYRQLDEASNRLAHIFRSVGVGMGERIALMLENHPRHFEICWAAQRAGIVYTAISSRLTAGEAAYIVGDCGAKVFICSKALAAQAAELRAHMPQVHTRLMLEAADDRLVGPDHLGVLRRHRRHGHDAGGLGRLAVAQGRGRPRGGRRGPHLRRRRQRTASGPERQRVLLRRQGLRVPQRPGIDRCRAHRS